MMNKLREQKKHFERLESLKTKVYTDVADLEVLYSRTDEPVALEDIDRLEFSPIWRDVDWGPHFSAAWFKVNGVIPKELDGKSAVVRLDIDGEGLYYKNGVPENAVTNVMNDVDRLQPSGGKSVLDLGIVKTGEKIEMLVDGGYNNLWGSARFQYAKLSLLRADIRDFYYDYLTAVFLKLAVDDNARKDHIEALLDKGYELLGDFSTKSVSAARAVFEPEFNDEASKDAQAEFMFTAVGHGHLDLAWLWPVRETRRKSTRTFAIQLSNTDRYPGYVFGSSQPEQFAYIKERFPEQFERIKQKVKDGQIELQGAMWVESDTNLVAGEALIRQLYYGKKFFRDEFDENMKICWLPDVFGYNGNLPQILAKSGVPYFMTIKLSWNEHNKFPHRTFNWQGIDGSNVLVHMPPAENYNSDGTPLCLKHAVNNLPEKDVLNESLFLFGIGDGGGGPGEAHIEMLKRQQKVKNAPRVRFERAVDFFERLNLKKDKLKTYKGELYLEKHQGTYTTQGLTKKLNRKTEYALCDLEGLCAYAYTQGIEYDHEFFDKTWKEVLLYHFHDIIPGSSIERVYKECNERYQIILGEIAKRRRAVLKQLAGKADNATTLFNPAPYERKEFVKLDGKWNRVEAKARAGAKAIEVSEKEKFSVAYNADTIENDVLKAVFNSDGEIVSLVDKKSGTEFCKSKLNRLVLYTDPKVYFNAWDIVPGYENEPKVSFIAHKSETFIDGPKVVRRNYYGNGTTKIVQEVSLTQGQPFVVFDTNCDFNETHKMLRADFYPNIKSDTVLCDIQMGSISRSAKNETSHEKAQYEICAHKYIDVAENDKGFTLMNNCKYGHKVKDGLISLALLRSPVYPDPNADRHNHKFSYAIRPRTEKYDAKVLEQSYLFNKELVDGCGSIIPTIAETDNKNIVVETIKKSQDSPAVIVRLFESMGKDGTCSLKTAFKYKKAEIVNLIEEGGEKVDVENLKFTPFEIKTIKLWI